MHIDKILTFVGTSRQESDIVCQFFFLFVFCFLFFQKTIESESQTLNLTSYLLTECLLCGQVGRFLQTFIGLRWNSPSFKHFFLSTCSTDSAGDSAVKNPSANAGHTALTPGSGRSPGEGSSNPLQYFCLEKHMDRGIWWATVHGVTKVQTWLSDRTTPACSIPGTGRSRGGRAGYQQERPCFQGALIQGRAGSSFVFGTFQTVFW